MQRDKKLLRTLVGCGMLTAVAVILQYIEISIPIMPSFLKLDFSDLPELIGAFAYGPLAGVIIALAKNLIHLPVSNSACIGELSNFLLGVIFAFVAGLVYKKHKTKKGALLGGISASTAMAVACIPINLFVIYPMYYGIGMPKDTILNLYSSILPFADSMTKAIIVFNLPFTFVKGLICTAIAMLIYKPLSPLLKGKDC